jgi:hypothetical protein
MLKESLPIPSFCLKDTLRDKGEGIRDKGEKIKDEWKKANCRHMG